MGQTPTTAQSLAHRIEEAGWSSFVRKRRAPEKWAIALGQLGIASSIDLNPGSDEWTLNLSKLGREVRKLLPEVSGT